MSRARSASLLLGLLAALGRLASGWTSADTSGATLHAAGPALTADDTEWDGTPGGDDLMLVAPDGSRTYWHSQDSGTVKMNFAPGSLGLTGSVVRDTDIELNPTYTLTQKDGTVVTYEGGEGRVSVQSITNARGDRLTFKEYNATESTIIRDTTGRTLTLNRDDEGHITDVG